MRTNETLPEDARQRRQAGDRQFRLVIYAVALLEAIVLFGVVILKLLKT